MTFSANRSTPTSELALYLRFCGRHPAAAADVVTYAAGRVLLRLRDRVEARWPCNERFWHYPPTIKTLAERCRPPAGASGRIVIPWTGWEPGIGPRLDDWTIPLATRSLRVTDIDWDANERDREDVFALHRFGWLLRWLSLRPPVEALSRADGVILDWIARAGRSRRADVWQTYSVAERMVAWLLYLGATQGVRPATPADDIIRESLHEQLDHVRRHLEYRGGACTNHILNDARGLYLVGRLLGVEDHAALALALVERHGSEYEDEAGDVLMGSSHYQLLITRSLLEMYWAARVTADEEAVRVFGPLAARAWAASLRLAGKRDPEQFPRIGDVSPDFPVEWFHPRDYDRRPKGTWWALWGDRTVEATVEAMGLEALPPSREWTRLDDGRGVFSIVVHTPRHLGHYPREHGHLDFGAFVLYDAEGCVLADRGRYSYTADPRGMYGFSPAAHNTTVINGFPLVPSTRGLLRGYRRAPPLTAQTSITCGPPPQVDWYTAAVGRIARGLVWRRELILAANEVRVVECIDNPGRHRLACDSYLHLAPGWKREDGDGAGTELVVAKDERRYRIRFGSVSAPISAEWIEGGSNNCDGWEFPDYGRETIAPTLRLSFVVSGDVTFEVALRATNE